MNGYLIPDWKAPPNVHAYTTTRDSTHSLLLPSEPRWLNQVHGKKVVCADKIKGLVDGDALYTAKRNVVCAVRTADCLPIFMTDKEGSRVAVIHAGWRSQAKGVIEETVKKLRIKPENLVVWFGPAIGPHVYEVGPEMHDFFLEYPDGFRRVSEKKWLANLYVLARERLHKLGVKKISGGTECTYTNNKKYYSARQQDTGRLVSMIWKS